jgi:hypothetical protein
MFARTIGGSVGVALAGGVFASGVAFASASGVDPNLLISSAGRSQIAPEQVAVLQTAVAHTLANVFLVMVGASLCAAGALAFLPMRVHEPEPRVPSQADAAVAQTVSSPT